MFGREFARDTWLKFHGRPSDRRRRPGASPGDVSPSSCPCSGAGMGSDRPGRGHVPLAGRTRGVHGAALRPTSRRPARDAHSVRRLGTLLAAVIAAGSGMVVTAQIAAAAITCSSASLIAAITTANKASGGTVTLGSACTIALTAANNTTDGGTGLPVITGKVTIAGNGATIERSTATGTPAFRIFDVASGGKLTLNSVVLSNGLADDGHNGGGAVNSHGDAGRQWQHVLRQSVARPERNLGWRDREQRIADHHHEHLLRQRGDGGRCALHREHHEHR